MSLWHWRKWLPVAAVLLVVLLIAAGAGRFGSRRAAVPAPDASPAAAPAPAQAGDRPGTPPADGAGGDAAAQPAPPPAGPPLPPPQPAAALPGPVAVMIDNDPNARPQSGLDRADLVYELPMEGEVTRFMAVFASQGVAQIGPVRSARTYFVELAATLHLPYAHAGGNSDALDLLSTLKVKNFDEIYAGGGYFWRSSGRQPPFNLYTSTDQLLAGVRDRGYAQAPPLALPRGAAPAGGEAVSDLTLRFYGTPEKPSYHVVYHFNGQGYERSLAAGPHVTTGGVRLAPPNLAVLVTDVRWHPSPTGEDGVAVDLRSGGTALFLRDGRLWRGQWRKAGQTAPLELLLDGRPFPWGDGPVWIHMISSSERVSIGA